MILYSLDYFWITGTEIRQCHDWRKTLSYVVVNGLLFFFALYVILSFIPYLLLTSLLPKWDRINSDVFWTEWLRRSYLLLPSPSWFFSLLHFFVSFLFLTRPLSSRRGPSPCKSFRIGLLVGGGSLQPSLPPGPVQSQQDPSREVFFSSSCLSAVLTDVFLRDKRLFEEDPASFMKFFFLSRAE